MRNAKAIDIGHGSLKKFYTNTILLLLHVYPRKKSFGWFKRILQLWKIAACRVYGYPSARDPQYCSALSVIPAFW